jgi:hypothetical protein
MQPNSIYPTMERRRTLAITAAGQQPASLLIAKAGRTLSSSS